jgi:DNA-binding XRE family transcriptional regulator
MNALAISPTQLRAARAMLDWSQGDMANASGVSLTTIRSFEMGFVPRRNTMGKIARIVEDAGLELIESDGIKRRSGEIKIYQGPEACENFFDDMRRSLIDAGSEAGDIVALFRSRTALMAACSMTAKSLGLLDDIAAVAPVKCLLPEALPVGLLADAFQFRLLPKQYIGPVSYFVYAQKHAVVLAEGAHDFRFLVYSLPELSRGYREHFAQLWDSVPPVLVAHETGIRA